MMTMNSSEEFQDPFSYKPLKRKRRNDSPQDRTKKTRNAPARKSPAKKSPAKKSPAKISPKKVNFHTQTSPEKNQGTLDTFLNINKKNKTQSKSSGVCPICQMPFELLEDGEKTQVHAEQCVESSTLDEALECSDGLKCSSRYKSHYTQFKHTLLAEHRVGFDFSTQILEHSNEQGTIFSRGDFPPLERETIPPTPIPPTPILNSTALDSSISPIERKEGEDEHVKISTEISGTTLEEVVIPRPSRPRVNKDIDPRSSRSRVNKDVESLKLGASHVNRFLSDIGNSDQRTSAAGIPPDDGVVELLRDQDDRTPRTHHQDDRNTITGYSQVAGPSGVRPDNRAAASEGLPGQQQPAQSQSHPDQQDPADGQGHPDQEQKRDNGKHQQSKTDSEGNTLQVRAMGDSEELEVSMSNFPKKVKKVKVRVPMKSPDKKVEVKTFFESSGSSGNSGNSMKLKKSENLSGQGDYVMVKKARFDKAVSMWNKIFSKKTLAVPHAKELARQNGGVPPNVQNGAQKRKMPSFKRVRGTSFTVDAFNFGVIPQITHYFLSHYHYDHFQGLTRHWTKKIVCSSLTKRCLVQFLKVKEDLITAIDAGDEARMIDDVEVSVADANHCPGAVMFIFKLTNGQTILHVGDFRADPEIESNPIFWNYRRIDLVYLDTTYCDPSYDFPLQHDVIQHAVEKVEEICQKHKKIAVLVGAYTIGKERIFKAIAKALDCKVWANPKRQITWRVLQDDEINNRIVQQRSQAKVHVIEQGKLNWKGLEAQKKELKGSFDHILGIKPTGWTHEKGSDKTNELRNMKVETRGNISFLQVPYSEHSSYSELKRFIQFLRIKEPKQIIPTVNPGRSREMNGYFSEWIKEGTEKGPESQ